MFYEPERTAYDWNFRILDIPVRVHPLFWLMSAIFGWGAQQLGWQYLVIWILCVFVSILIHEMGHVLMGRAFGHDGHIVLFSFGGLAIGSSGQRERWKRILVYAAGPAIQFVLLGAVILLARSVLPPVDPLERLERGFRPPPLGQEALEDLFFINLYWPLLNLLPIWPLDGGRISREILDGMMGERGIRGSLGLSMFTAGLLAANSAVAMNQGRPLVPYLPTGGWFTVFFFGYMAYLNYQDMQMRQHLRRHLDED